MTPAEFKAGRELKGLSVADAAASSKVSVSTIRRFERGERIHDNNHAALRRTLEELGVVVLAAGQLLGDHVVEGGVAVVRAVGGA